jgi:hypothetical protein
MSYVVTITLRVSLASIRNLGRCHCPRCEAKLEDAPKMGQKQDMQKRINHPRVDDLDRRDRVERARNLIYEQNYAVNSNKVKDLLYKDSLVPTNVCAFV